MHYILPNLSTPSTLVHPYVVVHEPRISFLDFFKFATQIGPVHDAEWTSHKAAVTYHSKEHTDRCFDELVSKGYRAAITVVGAPYDRELR